MLGTRVAAPIDMMTLATVVDVLDRLTVPSGEPGAPFLRKRIADAAAAIPDGRLVEISAEDLDAVTRILCDSLETPHVFVGVGLCPRCVIRASGELVETMDEMVGLSEASGGH